MKHDRFPSFTDPDADGADAARIGPNAVIQLGEAFRAQGEEDLGRAVYAAARCPDWFDAPPGEMIGEDAVASLHRALYRMASPPLARALSDDAGARTGAYILANRIPAPARVLLRALPAGPAARILLSAISAHAWTFAGSGVFAHAGHRPTTVLIAHNPLAIAPGCVWHTAVFRTLFRELVHAQASVTETECCGRGDPACRFEIDWMRPARIAPVGLASLAFLTA